MLRLLLLLAAAHAGPGALGTLEDDAALLASSLPAASAGRSLAVLDLNADGFDDLVVGAPTAAGASGEVGAGAVWFLPGSASGLPTTLEAGGGVLELRGQQTGGALGWAVESVGDLNGDGFDDLAIGEPMHPAANPAALPGQVRLLFGAPADPRRPAMRWCPTSSSRAWWGRTRRWGSPLAPPATPTATASTTS